MKTGSVRSTESRRHVISLLGTAAATSALGPWTRAVEAFAAVTPRGCVVRPQQTEGPFFLDERDKRSDLCIDSKSGAAQPGMPLDITFAVSRLEAAGCSPLAGAVVDVWNAGMDGQYAETALRGYQVTDESGAARFRTVFPGWYSGRAVHVHFKIRTQPDAAAGHEFTSQVYFDEALLDEVHAKPPYDSRGRRAMRNAADGLFRRGGAQLILPVARGGDGYRGTFDIALEV